jgi:hypothetical protein
MWHRVKHDARESDINTDIKLGVKASWDNDEGFKR